MSHILMHTDNSKFNDEIKRLSIHLPELTEILGAYNSIGVGKINGPQFQSLVREPASFIFDKMTNGEDVVIGGLKINKAKALDILEKPAGYERMVALIQNYKAKPNWEHHLDNVDLDGSEVTLKQCLIDCETEACKIYATTDKEKRVFEFAEGLIALAEAKFGDTKPDLAQLVNSIITTQANPFGSQNRQHTINAKNIKGWNYYPV